MQLRLSSIVAAATLAASFSASAGPALVALDGGMKATSGSDQLYGWRFSTTTSLSVSALGVYDDDLDGMAVGHDIGIFDAGTQALLVSISLAAGTGGILDGSFRYATLAANYVLGPGSYVIAMTMPAGNADGQWILGNTPTTAAEITYLGSAFDGSSTLAFPNPASNNGFNEGMFGPNFLFEAAGPVPEPASLALVGLALAGLGAARRRRGS